MLLNDYQLHSLKTRVEAYSPEAAVFGLLSEAGEVAGIFQKMIRGDFNQDVAVTKLRKELGDVLWHIAAVAADNGWRLEDIAKDNLDKLESRSFRNVILGSGDDR